MTRIEKNKTKELYKYSIIIGYLFAILSIITIIMTILNYSFINGHMWFNLVIIVLSMITCIIAGLFIPVVCDTKIRLYRFTIKDTRDSNHLARAMNYLKDGNFIGAKNIFNDCIKDQNRKSFLKGIYCTYILLSDDSDGIKDEKIKIQNFFDKFKIQ